jgi:hypothetical protein
MSLPNWFRKLVKLLPWLWIAGVFAVVLSLPFVQDDVPTLVIVGVILVAGGLIYLIVNSPGLKDPSKGSEGKFRRREN